MAHMADNMTQDLWDASVFVEWQLKAEGYCKPQKVYVHAIKSHPSQTSIALSIFFEQSMWKSSCFLKQPSQIGKNIKGKKNI